MSTKVKDREQMEYVAISIYPCVNYILSNYIANYRNFVLKKSISTVQMFEFSFHRFSSFLDLKQMSLVTYIFSLLKLALWQIPYILQL